MSRREGRDSDSGRHRSRFDRESSPKRSRRDGKPVTERPASTLNLDSGDHSGQDQKHRRRLQDALPLEAKVAPDPKVESTGGNKDSVKKINGQHEGTKHSSDPTEASRSQSLFQHDERGQVGRSFSRREATERGRWRHSKDQQRDRTTDRTMNSDMQQRDGKSSARGGENRDWRYDRYFEMDAADPKPAVRKRPFAEKKIHVETETNDKEATDPVKPSDADRPAVGSERREERAVHHNPRPSDRSEKKLIGDREPNRGGHRNFSSRDRNGGDYYRGRDGFGENDGNYRGRDRFGERQGFPPSGNAGKWEHDLFDKANRSPTPKNEDDQIAKVEALLSL